MNYSPQFWKGQFDGEIIKLNNGEIIHSYLATTEQLCDLLGYRFSWQVEQIAEHKSEVIEFVNDEPFYAWTTSELTRAVNTNLLEHFSTDPVNNIPDLLMNLFKSFGQCY